MASGQPGVSGGGDDPLQPPISTSTATTTVTDQNKPHDEDTKPTSANRTGPAEVDLEKAPAVEADSDPNVVDWDGPDDPGNTINFSTSSKIINVGIISALTFVTPLASFMFAPDVPQLMAEFDSDSNLLADFVVSVYVLGFAVGPLVLAPTSELYGRAVIYHICSVGFIIFSVTCAVSTNLGMLIIFRFFQGCFGVAPVTNGTWCPLSSMSITPAFCPCADRYTIFIPLSKAAVQLQILLCRRSEAG